MRWLIALATLTTALIATPAEASQQTTITLKLGQSIQIPSIDWTCTVSLVGGKAEMTCVSTRPSMSLPSLDVGWDGLLIISPGIARYHKIALSKPVYSYSFPLEP